MKKFTTILFDVDGTLLDFDKTETEALNNTFIELGIEQSKNNTLAYSRINESLWKQLEEGKINKDKLKTERFKQFFYEINIVKDEFLASDIYIKHLSNSYFYIEGAMDVCIKLSQSHQVAIVTNGIAKVQHSRCKLSGLNDIFEHVFISDEIGCPKPKKEFFDYVFKELCIEDLDKVIIVGDSLTSDIKGGNNANIATCWYNPKGLENNTDSVCDYEIKSLYEIMEIVN